jgi:hypothetical protein
MHIYNKYVHRYTHIHPCVYPYNLTRKVLHLYMYIYMLAYRIAVCTHAGVGTQMHIVTWIHMGRQRPGKYEYLLPQQRMLTKVFPWQIKVKVTLRLTVGQSVAHDQIFIIVWQLRSCSCGAPSLTRGRVCLLYMLLALAIAVFLGSESLGSRHHILLSQFWDLLFVASYDSQGRGGGVLTRLHTVFPWQ